MTNSILAGSTNAAGPVSDFQSATTGTNFVIASGDHDLIENNPSVGGFPVLQTILFGVDPMLAPLADNGGPTQTMAPIFGSPAIGAGNSNATGEPATDQTGQPRTANGSIDIGAVEFQSLSTTISVAASDTSPIVGEAVTFTAQVAATATNTTPTGTVQFYIDGQPLGDPVPLVGGVAQSNPVDALGANSPLTLGAHVVTAQYVSAGPFASGTGQLPGGLVVSTATATTISAAPLSVQYGQAVQLSATVSNQTLNSGTPNGMVDFTDVTDPMNPVDLTPGGVALLGGTASVSPANLSVGTHEIIATFLGSTGFFGSTSAPQSVAVTTVRGRDRDDGQRLDAQHGPCGVRSMVELPDGHNGLGARGRRRSVRGRACAWWRPRRARRRRPLRFRARGPGGLLLRPRGGRAARLGVRRRGPVLGGVRGFGRVVRSVPARGRPGGRCGCRLGPARAPSGAGRRAAVPSGSPAGRRAGRRFGSARWRSTSARCRSFRLKPVVVAGPVAAFGARAWAGGRRGLPVARRVGRRSSPSPRRRSPVAVVSPAAGRLPVVLGGGGGGVARVRRGRPGRRVPVPASSPTCCFPLRSLGGASTRGLRQPGARAVPPRFISVSSNVLTLPTAACPVAVRVISLRPSHLHRHPPCATCIHR